MWLCPDLTDFLEDAFEWINVFGFDVDGLFEVLAFGAVFVKIKFSFDQQLSSLLPQVFLCFLYDHLVEFGQINNLVLFFA